MKLYEITEAIASVFELMAEAQQNGDKDAEQACIDTLDSLDYDLSEKLERMSKIVRNYESDIKALKEEAKHLSDRAKTIERQNTLLKDYMKQAMERAGKTKVDAGIFKVSIQQNGGVKPLQINCDPLALPHEFQTITITPDNDAIRKYLEAGGESELFEFKERGTSLRIR